MNLISIFGWIREQGFCCLEYVVWERPGYISCTTWHIFMDKVEQDHPTIVPWENRSIILSLQLCRTCLLKYLYEMTKFRIQYLNQKKSFVPVKIMKSVLRRIKVFKSPRISSSSIKTENAKITNWQQNKTLSWSIVSSILTSKVFDPPS